MEKVRVTIIPGTDGRYIASSDGKIYNRQGLEKSQVTDKWGYKTVGLRVDRKKKRFFVHRLVLMAFLPCDNMHALQVNHKDENKQNNNLSNLEWCTNEYNQRYGTKSARLSATRSHPIEAVDIMGKIDTDEAYRGVLSVYDYSILTLSHYTDDNAAGVKLSLVLQMPSPLNWCTLDENFDDEEHEDEPDHEIDVPDNEIGDIDISPIHLPKNRNC